ncbi:MAG: thiamine pyrophosphate-binding protein [Alphaproteobacteria bacterium]|nr:thiamine pyrophosphate-binding protein [Alphaproteobacteria bacterium]
MNNAELIVATLKKAGVNHGFGIPSGNVLPVMEAMRTGGIEFVLTAHEGSAGFAADVTGRLTGIPGFCIATLGPGATNLATGVGNAWLDRSPMIAMTCNLNTDQLGRRIQMYIDHHALFAPITKATLPLREGNVAETLAEAIKIATTEPYGPVHLDLPEDVALAAAQEEIPEFSLPQAPKAAPQADLDEAVAALSESKRPVAILGSTAMRIEDHGQILAFIEKHQIPFATTTMAKGLIDDDHPLAIGCIERACRQHQRTFLRSADLIVGVGYDTIEVEFEAWIGDTPLLQIDIDKADLADSVTLRYEVTGDLSQSLEVLADTASISNDWAASELIGHRKTFNELLRPIGSGFTAYQAIDAVRAALPSDGILSFDVGAHTHQIASQWNSPAAKRFLITNGWSSMGFGLPSAIAAKLACPDQPVVCLIGDGCFQMTCGELATAKRQGITLPVVVLDDRWLGLIRVKQMRRQYGIYGTELQPEEYRDPPEHYFGVPAMGVRNPEELRAAVENALNADGPIVIEAVVDSEHYIETVFD